MFIIEFIKRVKFYYKEDRIGPDILLTHWKLHYHSTMLKLCKKKFKKFADTASFRPGAYAICCSKISIGENVVIRPNTMIFADPLKSGGEVIIENNVLLGSVQEFIYIPAITSLIILQYP